MSAPGVSIWQQPDWRQPQPGWLCLVWVAVSASCGRCWWCSIRPSPVKEHKGDCCGSSCVWEPSPGRPMGPLHVEPAPLVSFVFSPAVRTASCTNKGEEKHFFLYFWTPFLKFHNSLFFYLHRILSDPSIAIISCLFNLLFLLFFAVISFHGVLSSAVPFCRLASCSVHVKKSFSKLYCQPLTRNLTLELWSPVCVRVADFRRLSALFAAADLEQRSANASRTHTPLQVLCFFLILTFWLRLFEGDLCRCFEHRLLGSL